MKVILKNLNNGNGLVAPQMVLLIGILTTIVAVNAATTQSCKQSEGMWGDVNPNIFYICDNATNKTIQLKCAEGRGFFNGLGYYGCIPYEEWPACITAGNEITMCDTMHMTEPWESTNPNKFHICRAENSTPHLVNCESGKGFINISTVNGGSGSGSNSNSNNGSGKISGSNSAADGTAGRIVGCTNWDKWRAYMKCMDFF